MVQQWNGEDREQVGEEQVRAVESPEIGRAHV